MTQPHLVNRNYSILLIGLGLIGLLARYFDQGDWQFTALIPAVFGLILLPMSNGIKNENKAIAHVVVLITLLVGVMMVVMITRASPFELTRKMIIFMIIALASFGATGVYVKGFIDRKKESN